MSVQAIVAELSNLLQRASKEKRDVDGPEKMQEAGVSHLQWKDSSADGILTTMVSHERAKREGADALLDEGFISHRRFRATQADQMHHATETDNTSLLLWFSAILFFWRTAEWQTASTIFV
jgi:hypothetical protein